MRIVITGAVGHISTNVTIEAIKRGHTVIGMDNLQRKGVTDNLKYLQKTYKDKFVFSYGDVRSQDDFKRLPKDIEGIVHAAANPGIPWSIQWPTFDFEINVRGTLNALEFAKEHGNIPFVYASTNKTFSDIINKIPIKETETRYVWDKLNGYESIDRLLLFSQGLDTLNDFPQSINDKFPVDGFGKYGHSMYGISKLCGELYVQEFHCQYGMPTAINKMSCIYGLFQKGVVEQGWASWMVQQIGFGNGEIEIFGTGKQVRDVLDARDVARLYIDEVEDLWVEKKCDGEVFTIGGGPENTVSLLEAIEEIEKQTGKKAYLTYREKRSADQDIYISSIKKVKEVLGWEPTIPFKQTIADMIQEYTV